MTRLEKARICPRISGPRTRHLTPILLLLLLVVVVVVVVVFIYFFFFAYHPSNVLVYLKGGSAETKLRAAALGQKLLIKTFYLNQSQYSDTGPTSPNADPITPVTWQDRHWSVNFEVAGRTPPGKNHDSASGN